MCKKIPFGLFQINLHTAKIKFHSASSAPSTSCCRCPRHAAIPAVARRAPSWAAQTYTSFTKCSHIINAREETHTHTLKPRACDTHEAHCVYGSARDTFAGAAIEEQQQTLRARTMEEDGEARAVHARQRGRVREGRGVRTRGAVASRARCWGWAPGGRAGRTRRWPEHAEGLQELRPRAAPAKEGAPTPRRRRPCCPPSASACRWPAPSRPRAARCAAAWSTPAATVARRLSDLVDRVCAGGVAARDGVLRAGGKRSPARRG